MAVASPSVSGLVAMMTHRGESPVEHMVSAVILVAPLDAQHVSGLRHHADGALVPPVAGADGAQLSLGEVLTYTAAVYAGLGVQDGRGKISGLLLRQTQHIKGQALGTFAPYAGERREFIYKVFKGCRKKGHIRSPDPEGPDKIILLCIIDCSNDFN